MVDSGDTVTSKLMKKRKCDVDQVVVENEK